MANGKLSMLSIVQKTMEALNLDEVNSISDSPDAEQIAQIAQDSAYDLLNQSEWPHAVRLTQLESIADADRPNYLRIPDDVVRIDYIKYDNTDPSENADDDEGNPVELVKVENMTWCKPQDFLNMVQARNTQAEGVEVITTFDGIRLPILTDQGPQYWTSFDDEYVVFDAVNLDLESTLQGNKSQGLMKIVDNIVIDDDYVLPAPAHFFSLWLADVKSTAFIYMKQEASPKDEQRARRALAVLRRSASRTDFDDGKVKYGRPVGGGYRPGYSRR